MKEGIDVKVEVVKKRPAVKRGDLGPYKSPVAPAKDGTAAMQKAASLKKEAVDYVVPKMTPGEREHIKRVLRLTKSKRDRFVGRREAVLVQLRNIELTIIQLDPEVEELEKRLGR